MALLKNELHDFATHNYVWTLSAMYPGEVNDPTTYKGTTGKLPIASTGGLGNRKTVVTEAEESRNTNVEFYLEDIELSHAISTTPKNPVSTTNTISFNVQEPYSLGLFMQSIAVAASKAGFSNHARAPFLLSLSFKGQKQDGTYYQTVTTNWVIQIGTISMRVNSSGSFYECTAVPWNHQAFLDSVDTIKTDIRIEGSTVGEILSYGPKSLATLINSYETRQSVLGNRLVPDIFQIDFPFDLGTDGSVFGQTGGGILGKAQSAVNFVQGGLDKVNNAISAVNTVQTSISNFGTALSNIGQNKTSTGYGVGQVDPSLARAAGFNTALDFSNTPIVNNTFTDIGASISTFAQSLSVSGISQFGNEIASSKIADDFNEHGNMQFGLEDTVWDKDKQILLRGGGSLQIGDAEARVFTFSAGTKISEIIETVVWTSKFGQELMNQPADGAVYNRVFRIHPRTYILSTAEMKRSGKCAARYVYEVYPFFVHSSRFSLPSSLNNYEKNIDDCVKAYNYVYTGLNRDVLDFELTFNTTYSAFVPADYGQRGIHELGVGGSAVSKTSAISGLNQTIQNVESNIGTVKSTLKELIDIYRIAGGTFNENSKTRTAYSFRQALLSDASKLVALDLTITGDPYFLNDSDAGNYVANPLTPNVNADLQVDALRADVFVLLKFNTPVDYSNDSNLLLPDPADAITGIYQVNTMTSSFSNGQFTQVLNLAKMQNPDKSTLSKVKRVIENFFNVLGALSNFAGVLGAEKLSGDIQNFMKEATPVANSLLSIATIGENISNLLSRDNSNILEGLENLEAVFGQVGALGQQIGQLRQSLPGIDGNRMTPPTSIRPQLRTIGNTTQSTTPGGPQLPDAGSSSSSLCDI
jgi:hypothetical protein